MLRFFVTSALAVWVTSSAWAGSCTPPTLEEAVRNADVIFKGTVNKVRFIEPRRAELMKNPTGDCGDKYVTFAVEKMWKGEQQEFVTAFSADGCVGLGGYFHTGEEEIMFLTHSDEYGLTTFICNAPVDVTESELEAVLKN